jgi:hypothetical protein
MKFLWQLMVNDLRQAQARQRKINIRPLAADVL